MDKSEKFVVRIVAFLISSAISISLFALFSTWAWTHLDPMQQEVVAATSSPWFAAQSYRATPESTAGTASGDGESDYLTVAASAARKP